MQLTMYDICLAYKTLSEIKKPSARVKKAVDKVEDHLCSVIEGMIKSRMIPFND